MIDGVGYSLRNAIFVEEFQAIAKLSCDINNIFFRDFQLSKKMLDAISPYDP